MIYTAIIEQTYAYSKRMKYMAKTDSFIETDYTGLFYERNFKQPYGWIKESGTPPCEHLDVIVMTDKEYNLGDEEKVRIIGVFYAMTAITSLSLFPKIGMSMTCRSFRRAKGKICTAFIRGQIKVKAGLVLMLPKR